MNELQPVPRVCICDDDDDDQQQQQQNKIKMIMSAKDVWFPVPGGNNYLQGLTVINQTATPERWRKHTPPKVF